MEGREGAPALAREGTRLAAALREAGARYPGRDLWVFTDGRATDGDQAGAAARAVVAAGGRVHVSAPQAPAADVALLAARGRRQGRDGVVVEVTVGASTDGEVHVRLVRDGRTVAEVSPALRAGTAVVLALEDDQAPPVGAAYEVMLVARPGTPNDDPANDVLALGVPGDRPSVLAWTDTVVSAWVGPELPFDLRHMTVWDTGLVRTADCIVLGSLPFRRIGDARVRELVRFVAGGGRLLVLGGPRSWAAGGWAGTSLEDELTGLRTPRPEGAGLALLVALDHSGSTADGALDHLRDAVLGVVDELAPGERLAVLPFTDRVDPDLLAPGWLQADDPPERRAAFVEALAGLTAGGGTDLVAAIRQASERAAETDARTKRVLLVSDGDPDHDPGTGALAALKADLAARDVGFGALLSGMPLAARRLAEHVATAAEDVIVLEEAVEIPSRLLHEIARLRATEEHLPPPAAVRDLLEGGTLAALQPSFVQALEFVPGASLLAEATWTTDPPGTWPFAAARRVGAGDVVALAWGPAAEASPQQAGAHLLPLVLRLAREADRGLLASRDQGDLVVAVPQARGAGSVEWVGGETSGRLLEIAPGVFRGPAGPGSTTGRTVRLPASAGGGTRALRVPVEPEPEHRGAGVDEAALQALARAGQGLRLEAGAHPPPGRLPPGPPLRPFLLVFAAMLLILDRAWAVRSGTAGEPPA